VEGEGGVRILDFGLTGRLTEATGERVRGTPGYVAPEVLDGAKYSRESDYYALGATLYRVLTGRAAFPGRDAAAVSRHRGRDGRPFFPSVVLQYPGRLRWLLSHSWTRRDLGDNKRLILSRS
jgi:serine/threonine protein kinase